MEVLAISRMRWTAAALLLAATPAEAAPSRVWVSGDGIDTPECGIVIAPCRTFYYAHDIVADGGEIDVRDPGDFGAVVITKSISIINDRAWTASVRSISILGGSVLLRGLVFDRGKEGADHGLSIDGNSSTKSVTVENCLFRNFSASIFISSSAGIFFIEGWSPIALTIRKSVFQNNEAGLKASLSTNSKVSIDDSEFSSNKIGVSISNNGRVSIDRSTFYNNNIGVDLGIFRCNNDKIGNTTISDTLFDTNWQYGIRTSGCYPNRHVNMTLSSVAITDNKVGIAETNFQRRLFPVIYSYGNNNLIGNGADFEYAALISVAQQ